MIDWLDDHPVIAALLVVLVVWLVLTLILWGLVPVAFPGTTMGFWQAGAMAILVALFGGGAFFLGHH